MQLETFSDGYAIHASFPDPILIELIQQLCPIIPLTVCDPPYGLIVPDHWDHAIKSQSDFATWMIAWLKSLATLAGNQGNAAYVFGGLGKPKFRPFAEVIARLETETPWTIKNVCTWSKRRAYGVQDNYLWTREELLFLTLGPKPKTFNVPYLEQLRGYEGFNAKYPAKSAFLRRTNVWNDITEIFKGKVHVCQKPTKLIEVPILTSSNPGDCVLDPFAGSGSTALAAINTKRRFIVVENDQSTFDLLCKRIENHD